MSIFENRGIDNTIRIVYRENKYPMVGDIYRDTDNGAFILSMVVPHQGYFSREEKEKREKEDKKRRFIAISLKDGHGWTPQLTTTKKEAVDGLVFVGRNVGIIVRERFTPTLHFEEKELDDDLEEDLPYNEDFEKPED